MILHATNKDVIIKESERLISGSVKIYNCEFTFDESWDGFAKTVVFSTNGSRLINMALVDNTCEIPVEVLRPNARIRIGVYGTDGVRSRPTTYSEWIPVEQGADVTGDYAVPPTPSVFDQWVAGIDQKHNEWNEQEQARAGAEAARVEAENARVEAEQKREDLEAGYVAQAKAYAESANQSKESAAESKASAETAKVSAEQSALTAQTAAANALNYSNDAAYSAAQAKDAAANVADASQHAAEAKASAETATKAATEASASETAAKAAQAAAEKARDEAGEIAGGDFASKTEAQGYADTAEDNANKYTDQKIAAIPTPDVSGQIGTHNSSSAAHSDIRTLISNHSGSTSNPHGVTAAQVGAPTVAEMNAAIAAIPTPDVSGQINEHNASTSAHSDIRAYVTPVDATSTDGVAYTATVAGLTELSVGCSLMIVPTMTSTSAGSVTLNVNGTGAKAIKRWDNTKTSEWWSFTAPSWMVAGYPIRVKYTGTYWMVEGMSKPYATDLSGQVPIANGGTGASTAAAALANLGAAPAYTYGTADLTAGSSSLETGKLYFVYE